MTVSSVQRSGLSRVVSGLRVLFEDDYANVLEGSFGIHVSGRRAGEIEEASALSLSAHQLAARGELVGVVEYLRGEGLSPVEAVERMLREATFTTVNRLLAVRVAEAIGVLPPSLADGRASLGFVEALEVFPLSGDADSSGGYWSYLQVCGDELSHAVPRLFDRRHPLSVLEPSSETLDQAVELLADPEVVGVWGEAEALGWSYQFFNTQEERRAMRDESSAPRDSRELAVRNQFFTPSYVVDFLVENTLGRRLHESGSGLDLPLLLGEVNEDAPPLDLNDVSVLDPAVGSGHFLLGAYDLLERAWGEQGVSPQDSASRILESLFGVDIDARASQVAQAVLYLRARRSAPVGSLEPPSIVTARGLPKDPDVWGEVLADAPPLVRDVVEGLGEVLEQASVLGSLLKPEEYLAEAIGERLDAPRLGDEALGSFEDVEALVLDAAQRIASEAASSPAERLFAADASDALEFVDIMTRRYDTVLMNPPFGEPIPGTKGYIKEAYPWVPWKDSNVLAAFVGRGLDLSTLSGVVGAITSRAGFFLTTYESWREEIVVPSTVAMADLGLGVMEDALVETAAYVLAPLNSGGPAAFIRVLEAVDKEAALRQTEEWDISWVSPREFQSVPGSPMSYWVSSDARELFSTMPPTDPTLGTAAQGLVTGDDFRFVRAWWEIDLAESPQRWFPFAKGGVYQPYFSDLHLVVDWERGGERIRSTGRKARVQATRHFGVPGFTWPERTASSISFGPLPEGTIFSAKGPAIVHPEISVAGNAVLNSRLYGMLVDLLMAAGDESASGTAARDYTVGTVKKIPYPAQVGSALEVLSKDLWALIASWNRVDSETVRLFASYDWRRDSFRDVALPGIDMTYVADRLVNEAAGVSNTLEAELATHQGPHPGEYPRDVPVDGQELRRLLGLTVEELVEDVRTALGGARYISVKSYSLDRRVELIAHLLRIHPETLIAAAASLGIRGTSSVQISKDRLSYLVGCVVGRWDVRIGGDPSLAPLLGDPFDPLPVCPPGMLTGEEGLPVSEAPEGYPISMPPDRILHDDPGHEWDIVARMEDVAEFLFDDPDGDLREALGHLKARDLRSYLRSKFFPSHLSRYSKSRRKAPIYWYLAVPSKEWGLWVYAPWLSREQLFAVARAAQDKMRHLADEASQLRRDVDAGGGRGDRERLETVEALLEEVADFHRVADSVAQSGWEPDLNDGIILNAAPLHVLFADKKWRGDVEKHRKKMINGDYPWATVQTTYYDRIES